MKHFFSDTLSTLISFGVFYVLAFRGIFPVLNGQGVPVTVTNPETQEQTQQVLQVVTNFNFINFGYASVIAMVLGSLVAFGLRHIFLNYEFKIKIKLPFGFSKKNVNGYSKNQIDEAMRELRSPVSAGKIDH